MYIYKCPYRKCRSGHVSETAALCNQHPVEETEHDQHSRSPLLPSISFFLLQLTIRWQYLKLANPTPPLGALVSLYSVCALAVPLSMLWCLVTLIVTWASPRPLVSTFWVASGAEWAAGELSWHGWVAWPGMWCHLPRPTRLTVCIRRA